MYRRRSWIWWVLLMIGSMACGTYLLFNVLDLDQSSLLAQLDGNGVAAVDAADADAERLLRTTLAATEPLSLAKPLLALGAAAQIPRTASSALPGSSPCQNYRILPRMRLTQETSAANTSTADPA